MNDSMKCPYCDHHESKVIDSRESEDLETTRRRRECEKCGKRFTTYERVENLNLIIIKKDGKREQFNRSKILSGLQKACEKRPVTVEQMEKLVDEIETEIKNMAQIEIPSKIIGELVMQKLKKLDKVAYIRFASVYRQFADVEEFEKELKKLLEK